MSSLQSPSPRNPVSLRLYKVLGASFDDEGAKQALYTLSELYAPRIPSTNVNPTNHESEDSDHDDGSDSLPSFLSNGVIAGESAAKARKYLRRDVENKLAEASRTFLKAFGEVDQVCSFYMLLSLFMYLIYMHTAIGYSTRTYSCYAIALQ
jgi:hypothetical protein